MQHKSITFILKKNYICKAEFKQNTFLYCYSISHHRVAAESLQRSWKEIKIKQSFFSCILWIICFPVNEQDNSGIMHVSFSFYCNDKSTDCTVFVFLDNKICSLWIFKLTIQMMKLKQLNKVIKLACFISDM